MGHKFKSNQTGWFWLGIFHEAAGQLSAGAAHLRVRLGQDSSPPAGFTLMTARRRHRFLAGCWQAASAPHHRGSSLRLVSVLTAWWLASPKVDSPKEEGKAEAMIFYDLTLKWHVTISAALLWSHRLILMQCWRGPCKGMSPRWGGGSWGIVLESDWDRQEEGDWIGF